MATRTKTSFSIDVDLLEQVKTISKQKDTTATELYNKWIREKVENKAKATKQSKLKELLFK